MGSKDSFFQKYKAEREKVRQLEGQLQHEISQRLTLMRWCEVEQRNAENQAAERLRIAHEAARHWDKLCRIHDVLDVQYLDVGTLSAALDILEEAGFRQPKTYDDEETPKGAIGA